MSHFSELSTSTLKAIDLLISDETLCKLLYYNTKDAVYKTAVTNPESLIKTKIFPFPKLPQIETAAGTFINVFFDDISPNGDNNSFRDQALKFMIIMHLDVFDIDNGIRLYTVMERIDTLFNKQHYQEIAGHNLKFVGRSRLTQWNGDWFGTILSYGMVNDSNIGA